MITITTTALVLFSYATTSTAAPAPVAPVKEIRQTPPHPSNIFILTPRERNDKQDAQTV